jgi:hypothetical protein
MMRSVYAVLMGFIFIGVLAFGTDAIIRAMSPWAFDANGATSNLSILILMMVYSSIYGMVGCYIAARFAPSHPMRHALILGVIGVAVGGMQIAALWSHAPAWYNILSLALILPLAWLGGRLRENELVGKASPVSSPPVTA